MTDNLHVVYEHDFIVRSFDGSDKAEPVTITVLIALCSRFVVAYLSAFLWDGDAIYRFNMCKICYKLSDWCYDVAGWFLIRTNVLTRYCYQLEAHA